MPSGLYGAPGYAIWEGSPVAQQRHDSRQLATPFRWTAVRERAVLFVVEDIKTDEAIAAELGIHRDTLASWKRHPDFAARVEHHREVQRQAIEAKGIADKQNRIRAMNRRAEKLWQVIDARAADPTMANVPGGDTGLMTRTVKWVKQYNVVKQCGEPFDDVDPEELERVLEDDDGDLVVAAGPRLVSEYAIDQAVLNELLKLEQAVARELGQLTEKREVTGKDGAPLMNQQVIVYLPDNGRDRSGA